MKIIKLPFAPKFTTQSPAEKCKWPETETVSPTLCKKTCVPLHTDPKCPLLITISSSDGLTDNSFFYAHHQSCALAVIFMF